MRSATAYFVCIRKDPCDEVDIEDRDFNFVESLMSSYFDTEPSILDCVKRSFETYVREHSAVPSEFKHMPSGRDIHLMEQMGNTTDVVKDQQRNQQ